MKIDASVLASILSPCRSAAKQRALKAQWEKGPRHPIRRGFDFVDAQGRVVHREVVRLNGPRQV